MTGSITTTKQKGWRLPALFSVSNLLVFY